MLLLFVKRYKITKEIQPFNINKRVIFGSFSLISLQYFIIITNFASCIKKKTKN